jgi:excisionase family DNA binding protein
MYYCIYKISSLLYRSVFKYNHIHTNYYAMNENTSSLITADFKKDLVYLKTAINEIKGLLKARQGNDSSPGGKKYYNTKQLAELLGINQTSVYQLTNKKVLPYRKVGKRVFFLADDVEEYMNKNKYYSNEQIEERF